MSHERTSYTVEKSRLSVLDRAKKTGVTALALVTGGAMLGGLSGCGGEKAGASEVPTTPAATAPKTPETTKTPEKVVPLTPEVKAYAKTLTPENLADKSEKEMTAMFANMPSDNETDKMLSVYAGIDAIWKACTDKRLVKPFDSKGVIRETEDLEHDCGPYYRAGMNGIFGVDGPDSDHIGTIAYRRANKMADQELYIDMGFIPREKYDKYELTSFLRSVTVDENSTMHLSIDVEDFKGPDDPMAQKTYRDVAASIGGDLAKRGAIGRDHLDLSWNPKTGAYSDMAKCVKDASGTPCK